MLHPNPDVPEPARQQALLELERQARVAAESSVARLTRELASGQRGMELLQTITIVAKQATHVEDAMQIALNQVAAHTGWPLGHVYLQAEGDTMEFVPLDVWHAAEPERFAEFRKAAQSARLPGGKGLPGRVFGTGKAAWVRDLTAETDFPGAKLLGELGLKTAFAFPLLIGPGVVGVMEFFSPPADEPDARLTKIMHHLGAQLGRVIERQQAQDG